MGIAQVASGWGAMLTAVESEPPDETIDPGGARGSVQHPLAREDRPGHPEIDTYMADVLQAVTGPIMWPTRTSSAALATTRGASARVDGCLSS